VRSAHSKTYRDQSLYAQQTTWCLVPDSTRYYEKSFQMT